MASPALVYSGDVVPDSSVFVMDTIPDCDLLMLDASYGADPVAGATRAKAIAAWIEDHADGLPVADAALRAIVGADGGARRSVCDPCRHAPVASGADRC